VLVRVQFHGGDKGALMIETHAVEFVYEVGRGAVNGALALDGVTLGIGRGEFVAVLGRNGSGKSTLARMFNALLQPGRGVVRIGGVDTRDGARVWDIRKSTGMVFQDPDNQFVGSTVEEDTAFGPENLGLSPEEIGKLVGASLLAVGMEGQGDRAPHHLSGGEKQRVALAGILAMEPDCIILDEATAMLDPVGRQELMELVRGLNRQKRITVIQITHDMDEAARADRVLVVDAGKIVMDGKPTDVCTDVARLKDFGLEPPQVAELADLLRRDGFAVPPGILQVDEAAAALLALAVQGEHHVRQD
jgi:energy-coupling factor transport system ATP-binding protein